MLKYEMESYIRIGGRFPIPYPDTQPLVPSLQFLQTPLHMIKI